MITILFIVETYPDRQVTSQQLWREVSSSLLNADGFHSVRTFHDVDQSERYLILTEWEDRAKCDSFARRIGLPWLRSAWEYAPQPATVMYLEETSPSRSGGGFPSKQPANGGKSP